MAMTVMAVDSDKRLLSLVQDYLSMEGYRVLVASDVQQALRLARQQPPDLVLLEAMIPSAEEARCFLERYGSERPLPIILPMSRQAGTARALSVVFGLTDYIVKPFRPRDLMAHISAAFRRTGQLDRTPLVVHAGAITLDKRSRSVMVGTRYVDLTPSEFDLLAVLMSSPGRVVSRLDLLEVLQGLNHDNNSRLVDIHIKNLRAKIEFYPHRPRYIQTVYGFGYRFCAQPAESALAPSSQRKPDLRGVRNQDTTNAGSGRAPDQPGSATEGLL